MTIIINDLHEYKKIDDFLTDNNIINTYELYRDNKIYIFTTFKEYHNEITKKEVKQ